MSEKKVLVRIRGLAKDYKRGVETVHVLQALDLDIREGEFLALMGPSGSGKSTLLNLIGGLDRPSRGEIEVGGQRIDSLGDGALGPLAREPRRLHLSDVQPAADLERRAQRRAAVAADASVARRAAQANARRR